MLTPMDAPELPRSWKEGRTEEHRGRGHHGQSVVDATVRGGSITANLFVFPHRVAEVDCVPL